MKLETLKSEKFGTLNKSQMSIIKGGDYVNTSAVVTSGTSTTPAGSKIPDRQKINDIRNLHGVITGHTLNKLEYLIDGAWSVGS